MVLVYFSLLAVCVSLFCVVEEEAWLDQDKTICKPVAKQRLATGL